MTLIIRFCMIMLALACATNDSFGWGATGHMVVGAIAYGSLSAPAQQKVRALLEHHPAYKTWMSARTAEDPADTGLYLVICASHWPDDVRSPVGNTYGHTDWHFINYPLVPPSYPTMPSLPGKDSIIGEIAANAATVGSTQPDSTRAIALSWLIHLIGDLHQPLHSATMVDSMFPGGDLGGNSFYVRVDNQSTRLHSFWDNLPGTTRLASVAAELATSIAGSHSRASLPELTTSTTVLDWSMESRERAIIYAYQYKGVRIAESNTVDAAVEVPEGYVPEARELADMCVALAGYRLADAITSVVR